MEGQPPPEGPRPYRGTRGGAGNRAGTFYQEQDLAAQALQRLVRIQMGDRNFTLTRVVYDQNSPYTGISPTLIGLQFDPFWGVACVAAFVPALQRHVRRLQQQAQQAAQGIVQAAAAEAAAGGAAGGAPESRKGKQTRARPGRRLRASRSGRDRSGDRSDRPGSRGIETVSAPCSPRTIILRRLNRNRPESKREQRKRVSGLRKRRSASSRARRVPEIAAEDAPEVGAAEESETKIEEAALEGPIGDLVLCNHCPVSQHVDVQACIAI